MIPWFESNNQNQNSTNDENKSNYENADDVFNLNEKIPENLFFHSNVEDMMRVGEIALTKANHLAHFFYFLYITKEQEGIAEIVKDGYGHKYHSGRKMICGKYLQIFKDDVDKIICWWMRSCCFVLLCHRTWL